MVTSTLTCNLATLSLLSRRTSHNHFLTTCLPVLPKRKENHQIPISQPLCTNNQTPLSILSSFLSWVTIQMLVYLLLRPSQFCISAPSHLFKNYIFLLFTASLLNSASLQLNPSLWLLTYSSLYHLGKTLPHSHILNQTLATLSAPSQPNFSKALPIHLHLPSSLFNTAQPTQVNLFFSRVTNFILPTRMFTFVILILLILPVVLNTVAASSLKHSVLFYLLSSTPTFPSISLAVSSQPPFLLLNF